ncbi:hypothetical protein AB0I69_22105 [Streptomyces sp. NPDC050508]
MRADPAERLDTLIAHVPEFQFGDEARDVMRWAASAVLEKALREAPDE